MPPHNASGFEKKHDAMLTNVDQSEIENNIHNGLKSSLWMFLLGRY